MVKNSILVVGRGPGSPSKQELIKKIHINAKVSAWNAADLGKNNVEELPRKTFKPYDHLGVFFADVNRIEFVGCTVHLVLIIYLHFKKTKFQFQEMVQSRVQNG